jgi:hypothetical protein
MCIRQSAAGACGPSLRKVFVALLCCAWSVFALTPNSAAQDQRQPAQAWAELFERSPFAYRIPLARDERTPIDGTYTRSAPLKEAHVHCLRCPDWLPEGGVWKISFDKGTFRIMNQDGLWRTMGSYYIALRRDRRQLRHTLAGGQPHPGCLALLSPAQPRSRHHRALAQARGLRLDAALHLEAGHHFLELLRQFRQCHGALIHLDAVGGHLARSGLDLVDLLSDLRGNA